jgi:endoglucanase
MELTAAPAGGKPDSTMRSILFPQLALVACLSAQQPVTQASEARLWLKVPDGQSPLKEIQVSAGTATPAPWEKDPAVRERHTDILFPIRWWSWSGITVSFTPAQDGTVDLVLNGPWVAEKDGVTPREEILWDEITAEGTELRNGGFEETAETTPASWKSPWAPYIAATEWPLAGAEAKAGKTVAATTSKRPLSQPLEVKAGRKVTIRLHAKAALPPGITPPKRLGQDTPAHRALARLKRGVNLGNGWEAPPPNGWGVKFTTEDIDHIAAEGFDHIRVPVAWHFHLKPKDGGMEIDPAFLAEIEPVLRRALEKKLHVFLNWHHFHDFTNDPAANLDRFVAGWETIADHFKSWPPGLFFELLNEPCDALTTEVANPIYQKTISAIRKTNPSRILVVSPGNWGIVSELEKLRLPDSDDRLAVTIHCYEPFHFTHQGAGWVGLKDLRGITYPGPPQSPYQIPDSLKDNPGVRSFVDRYNSLPADQNPSSMRLVRDLFDTAAAWSREFGRPIYLGEFGSHNTGDIESRSRYLRDVRTLAEERGIPWSLWEWKANFGYWDPRTNQPRFRASLFE